MSQSGMRVLVVGSGGREHALAWALSASPLLGTLFVAPGNAGTAELAQNVPVAVTDLAGLVAFAVAERINLVVPGPEGPLVAGLVDRMAWFHAPGVIGGDGLAGVAGFGVSALAELRRFRRVSVREVGEDLLSSFSSFN